MGSPPGTSARAREVDVHDPVVGVVGEAVGWAVAHADADVVVEDVDAAERLDCCSDDGSRSVVGRDVGRHDDGLAIDGGGGLLRP